MQYVGGKGRGKIRNWVLDTLHAHSKPNQVYFEPFAGAGNIVSGVQATKRYASDYNLEMVALLQSVANGEKLARFDTLTVSEYQSAVTESRLVASRIALALKDFVGCGLSVHQHILDSLKDLPTQYTHTERAIITFGCSFAAKYAAGFARDTKGAQEEQVYFSRAINSYRNKRQFLEGVIFMACPYDLVQLPHDNMLIYCDPPYAQSKNYYNAPSFDHAKFYQWCRDMSTAGHTVLVSETQSPDDFYPVATLDYTRGMRDTNYEHVREAEKIFMYRR